MLWSQAPLAGVCDQASTLSQTCLHAARVARGDACVARVLNDDAISAARACLDRLNGDKNSTTFFEGLEAHARKEADILAKSSNAAEKILSRRLRGAFRVKLPTDCSQDSLRWAARLAIAIASELCADDTRVFLSSNFWAAGPGAAWRVWRDGKRLEDEGVAGFRERYGPNSFTLNHRFYLHLDNTNQLWLSAEDGCEGRLVDPGEKKKLFGLF